MRVCPTCHEWLVPSTRVPGAWLCSSAWDDCDRSGVLIELGV